MLARAPEYSDPLGKKRKCQLNIWLITGFGFLAGPRQAAQLPPVVSHTREAFAGVGTVQRASVDS